MPKPSPTSSPFNHIVVWTWYLLALAAALLRLGWTFAESRLAQTLLLAGAYALGSATLASNACAGWRFARDGEAAGSFVVCDAVGVAVGLAVEAAVLRGGLAEEDWAYVGDVPGRARDGVAGVVAVVEDVVVSVAGLTGREGSAGDWWSGRWEESGKTFREEGKRMEG